MSIPEGALFNVDVLLKEHGKFIDGYNQFLKVPSLRAGIYELMAGADDKQTPHKEDEIYFVLSGRGRLSVKGTTGIQEFEARSGSILFVKAGLEHHFHAITEDLRLLVFFSSARTIES